MNKSFSNPCNRCGKERIVVKVWDEQIGCSKVTTTETACPDPECQKIVNKANAKQKAKYTAMKLRSQNRITNRKRIFKSANGQQK